MGLRKVSGCANDRPNVVTLPNPNKYNWKLIRMEIYFENNSCVVIIQYPDCTNYEGKKVLVYDNYIEFNRLKESGMIDPHFSNETYSPIARFEPTERGIKLATELARRL